MQRLLGDHLFAAGQVDLHARAVLLEKAADRFEAAHGASLRYRGFRLLAIDGTSILLPDAKALRKFYGTANNGSGKTLINSGLYPPAPDLRQGQTQNLTDGELFYIIKNGIRFTGMPGWGGEDEGNWKLVLFIRHLPQLSAKEIELMQEINHMEE